MPLLPLTDHDIDWCTAFIPGQDTLDVLVALRGGPRRILRPDEDAPIPHAPLAVDEVAAMMARLGLPYRPTRV